MPDERRDASVPLAQVSRMLERGLDGIDAERAAGLEGLQRLRIVKGRVLERERHRLEKSDTPDRDRLAALGERIESNGLLVRQLGLEAMRARTSLPAADARAWILHGQVLDRALRGVPQLVVALADGQGRRLERIGVAQTDDGGHFVVTIALGGGARRKAAARPEVPALFVHVLERRGALLHRDARPLQPAAGRVDYLEIVLSDDPSSGSAPGPGEVKPGGPPAAPPPSAPPRGRAARRRRGPGK